MAGGRKKWSKKRKIITIVIIAAAAAAAGVGGVFVFMRLKAQQAMGAMTSQVMSAQAATSSISNTVTGTGTLTDDDASDVVIPTGITIDKVLVESGDTVTEGQALATVNQTSVETAIADIQSSLTSIDTSIEALGDETTDETYTASIGGRIKQIFIADGDTVSKVMLTNSALLTISVDGLMAVDLNNSGILASGDSVTVTASDGTAYTGTVASAAGDTTVVTYTDNGSVVGDTVTVTNSAGTSAGAGTSYIHQPYQVTGTSGTVSSISVSENEAISSGDELFALTGVEDNTKKDELLSKREDLTQALNDMMTLKEKGEITASVAGTINSVNVEDGTEVTKSSSSSSSSTSTTSTSTTGGSVGGSATKTAYTGSSDNAVTSGNVTGFTLLSSETAGNTSEILQGSATEESATGESATGESATGESATGESATGESAMVESLTGESVTGGAQVEAAAVSSEASENDTSVASSTSTTLSVINEITVPLTNPKNGVLMTGDGLNGAIGSAAGFYVEADAGSTKGLEWNSDNTVAVVRLKTDSGNCFNSDSNGTKVICDQCTTYEYYLNDTDGDGYYDEMILTLSYKAKDTSSSPSTDSGSTGSKDTSGTSGNQGSNAQSSASQNAGSASAGGSGSGTGEGSVSGSGSSASGSASTGSSTESSTSSTDTSDLYSQYETAGFTIQTNENMKIPISVDELDILSIKDGDEAAITLDAVEDQTYTGTVSDINTTGSNSGGVTKYTVTIVVPKDDNMLSGMSASAAITVSSAENVVTIPSAALQENGNETFVYTSKDDSGNLSGEVTVETGLSDDTNVEITSGLSAGDTVYYQQSAGTKIETDDSSTTTGGMGGGNMGGGNMGGGNMGGGTPPSGGGMGGGN